METASTRQILDLVAHWCERVTTGDAGTLTLSPGDGGIVIEEDIRLRRPYVNPRGAHQAAKRRGWQLRGCGRCNGDLFYDPQDQGWRCLQCGATA